MKFARLAVWVIAISVVLVVTGNSFAAPKVLLGVDVLFSEKPTLLEGKRVGLITNQTGVNRFGIHAADMLFAEPNIELTALFGPEHGIRGEGAAGESINSTVDSETGVPIYSLYGKDKKPTPSMLEHVDVLVFDIQDIGARFYTYIYTMAYAMQAAAENGKEFVVLDRPNPIGGQMVRGPVLEPDFSSFAGLYPLPIVHGMTVGELALLFNSEFGIGADLTVVPMQGWNREMVWEETGLDWVKPSPNIPTPETALIYPATCFIEGTNISEGRGTKEPFATIGAPFVNSNLAQALNIRKIPGVHFEPVRFTPDTSKYVGEIAIGVHIAINDRSVYDPIVTGLHILKVLRTNSKFEFLKYKWQKHPFIDLLFGTDEVRKGLESGLEVEAIAAGWQVELDEFKEVREHYLLY